MSEKLSNPYEPFDFVKGYTTQIASQIAYHSDRQLLIALSHYEVMKYKGINGFLKKKIREWLGVTQIEGLLHANLSLRLDKIEQSLGLKYEKI